MDDEKIVKQFRKKYLHKDDVKSVIKVNYGKDEIKKIIQHREPFLLIDTIDTIDFENNIITGTKYIDPDDPILTGHFPGNPIYPGVLHLEIVGQLAICYYYFLKHKSVKIVGDDMVNVRATKVSSAIFQHGVLPGDTIKVTAKVIEFDDYKFKGIGQLSKGDLINTVLIGEFFIV